MTEAKHEGRAHALCSASGSERWLNCPGSIHAAKGLPPLEPTAAALNGTRCHELAEKILRRWEENGRVLDVRWVETLRPEYRDTEVAVGASGRPWSMVDDAVTYANLAIDEVESFDDWRRPGAVAVKIEHRLVLDQELGMFGTVDFFATGTRGGRPYGVVVDLKYGKKKVKPDSSQLSYYSVALKKNSKKALETVKVRVVQPRLPDFYTDKEYTREELEDWERRLKEGARRALAMAEGHMKPEYKAGGWCFFCQAWQVCPERMRLAAEKAAAAFDDEPLVLEEA